MTQQHHSPSDDMPNQGDRAAGLPVPQSVEDIVSALCDAGWLGLSDEAREQSIAEQIAKLDSVSRLAAIDQQWIDALLHQLSEAAGNESRQRVDRLMQAIRAGDSDDRSAGSRLATGAPVFVPGAELPSDPITGSPAATPGMVGWLGSSRMAWTLVCVLLVPATWLAWQSWFGSGSAVAPAPQVVVVEPRNEASGAGSLAPRGLSPVASIGRVESLESNVILERRGAKQNVVVGMELLPDDSIDVPAGGSAELRLANHLQAKLGPRTMLSFASAREATLREGFVQIDARHATSETPLAIATPDAQAQIHDAWLAMGADRKRTQIRVAEGRVVASRRRDGMAVEISEGYCSTISQAIDSVPYPSRSGTALLVVSTKAMAPRETSWERFNQMLADRIVGERMWRSAMPVRVRTYEELNAEDLQDCSLVVLSVFPPNAGVEQKLNSLKMAELPVPIVCMEPVAFPELGLTGPKEDVDFGFARAPLMVDMVAPGHPLAAGYVGDNLQLFAYKRFSYWWGRPADSAIRVAHVHDLPDRWLLFAYDQGDAMVQGRAPARRVGLFVIPQSADYDAPVLDVIDAAINWCLDSSPQDVTVSLDRFQSIALTGRVAADQSLFSAVPFPGIHAE